MKLKHVAICIIICIIGYLIGTFNTKTSVSIKDDKKVVKSLEKRIDTVYVEVVKLEETIVEKVIEREKLIEVEKDIIYDEEECTEIVENLKEQIQIADEVIDLKNELLMKKDTIIIHQEKIIEIKEFKTKPKRIGIGAQVGYGFDGKDIKPYIGVGISINIINI